jgi:hypothetical protein
VATTTKVTLENFHPDIDGSYTLDWSFKKRDWRTIKKIADVTPPELMPELMRDNVAVAVALAALALQQAGKPYLEEILWDDDGKITFAEEKDPDASPPDPESPAKPDASRQPSGESTNETGVASQETTTPNGSGHQSSDTGSTSAPGTLVISPPSS